MSGLIAYLSLALFISGVVSVISLHISVSTLVHALGEKKFLSDNSVNGCNVWPSAVLLSMVACLIAWRFFGWAGLWLTPAGPLITIFTTVLHLRFGERDARVKQFRLQEKKVLRVSDGTEIHPDHLVEDVDYYNTGPASGYCLYRITLKKDRKILAANGYANEGKKNEMLKVLHETLAVRSLSLGFLDQVSERLFRTLTLSNDWTNLILEGIHKIPSEDRLWWERFFRPRFKNDAVISLNPAELCQMVERFAGIRHDAFSRDEGLSSELAAFKLLAKAARGSIKVFTKDGMMRYIESHRGNAFLECRYKGLIQFHELKTSFQANGES